MLRRLMTKKRKAILCDSTTGCNQDATAILRSDPGGRYRIVCNGHRRHLLTLGGWTTTNTIHQPTHRTLFGT